MSRVCPKTESKITKFFSINILLTLFLFALCFLLFPTEKILAAGNTTGYAWSQEGGWIDFNPPSGGVTVSDSKLTGYAKGDEVGWINFDCQSTPGECPDNSQKVTNDSNGNLSGYAWGVEVGWLNFNCQAQAGCPSGSQKVVINGTTGNFSGYAWGDEIGWVSFEAGDGANVNTSWRPPSPPDLIIIAPLSAPAGALISGNTLTFSATVKNQGGSDSGAISTTRFKIDTDNNGSYDVTLTDQTTGNLVANGTEAESATWTAVAGTHKYQVCADNGLSIAESNEGNNCAVSSTFTVAAVPDFSLSAAPNTITVLPTDTKTSTITITSLNGFNQNVDLTATPSHACLTIGFSQNPVVGGSGTSTLTINTTNCAVGNHTITVQGDGPGGSPSHQITITVQVGVTLTVGNTSGYAWGENVGWISLNCDHTSLGLPLGDDTCASQEYGVLTTDDALYGYAWGENIGWISLNCNEEPIGGTNHCLTGGDGQVDYGVTNGNGVLSGYAWSENIGWISFDDPNPTNFYQVKINETGVFSGYAWSENIGWISFGDGVSYQGETVWRGVLGQLDKPFNLHHTNNPESPLEIWWQWDQVFVPLTAIETSYTIYMKDLACAVEPCTYYTNTGTHALDYNPTSAGTSLSVDYNDNPLSFNTQYTIKVMAVYPGYDNSDFSDPSSAYTSAASPINLQGTAASETQINWTWDSGCALGACESGFYAQNTQGGSKGWTTDLFWDQTGLSCGQNYILQVKAKNADFDGCVSDCGGDETLFEESAPAIITTLTDPLNFILSDVTDTSIKLTWDDIVDEEGYIVDRAEGQDAPGGYSQIYDTQAPDITLYNDTGLTQNTRYWYRVKAYSSTACDSGYAEADARTKGPQLAINPTTYPIGYIENSYNFGVLEPGESKSISMLICNVGDADLTVSSASISGSGSVNFSFTPPDSFFTLGVDPDYDNCDNNLAGQAKKQVVITFTSQSSCDPGPITSQADFILLNNDADKTVVLKGVCQESPVGEGEAAENIIYDGRIMANPPPAFVEFLEKLQFSEKIKPR